VLTELHRRSRCRGVCVVGGAHDYRINRIRHFVEHTTEVSVQLCPRKQFRGFCQVIGVHVAKGDDILIFDAIKIGLTSASDADGRDVKL
jgi:hypothetical protein